MPTDPELIKRANEEVFDSLELLAKAIEEGLTFQFHHRHIKTVADLGSTEDCQSRRGVLAAVTRAEVANIAAIFEKTKKSNRGSLGFVFAKMKARNLQDLLLSRREGQYSLPDRSKFIEAQSLWAELESDELNRILERVLKLRHRAVAHISRERSEEWFNEDLIRLHEHAERIVTLLYHGFGLPEPDYIGARDTLEHRARLFWDTYSAGLQALGR
jgi:hypothetical protein